MNVLSIAENLKLHSLWYSIFRDGGSRGDWGSVPQILLALLRHLNFHVTSALHKIRDLCLLVFLGGNTIGIVCKDSWTPLTVGTLTALAPQQLFSGAITEYITIYGSKISQRRMPCIFFPSGSYF